MTKNIFSMVLMCLCMLNALSMHGMASPATGISFTERGTNDEFGDNFLDESEDWIEESEEGIKEPEEWIQEPEVEDANDELEMRLYGINQDGKTLGDEMEKTRQRAGPNDRTCKGYGSQCLYDKDCCAGGYCHYLYCQAMICIGQCEKHQ